jgi:2-polyprenyl-6-methoxyphenol hydroxylase-like FAD-dependent oxidoreductase
MWPISWAAIRVRSWPRPTASSPECRSGAAAPPSWSQARPEGEEHRIVDPTGRTLVHHEPQPGSFSGRPEIDRSALRDLLLDSLPGDTVVWRHRLVAATPRPDGGWELTFHGGHRTGCDILIGADGARSVVRSLLTDVQLSYVATLVELNIEDVDRRHPDLSPSWSAPGTCGASA